MIYGWEDWEFWIAMLKNGGNVKELSKLVFIIELSQIRC
jgi:hypothetical protein